MHLGLPNPRGYRMSHSKPFLGKLHKTLVSAEGRCVLLLLLWRPPRVTFKLSLYQLFESTYFVEWLLQVKSLLQWNCVCGIATSCIDNSYNARFWQLSWRLTQLWDSVHHKGANVWPYRFIVHCYFIAKLSTVNYLYWDQSYNFKSPNSKKQQWSQFTAFWYYCLIMQQQVRMYSSSNRRESGCLNNECI